MKLLLRSLLISAIVLIASATQAQIRIPSLPYTITASGVYTFCSSLDYNGALPAALQITASDVTVDLKGHSITCAGTVAATQTVGISAFNCTNVTIRNGGIVGFSKGIELAGQQEFQSASIGALIENVRCTYNVNCGIFVSVNYNAVVRDCQISDTGYSPDGSSYNTRGIGIYDALGAGNLIYKNNITQVSDTGIVLGSNDLAEGNFVTAAITGVFCADPSSKLKYNVVTLATVPYQGGTQLPGTNF